MNRAFISLYLLIVASVIAIGWGLNALWESQAEAGADPKVSALFQLLEQRLAALPPTEVDDAVTDLGQQLGIQLDRIAMADMASSRGADALAAGAPVRVQGEHSEIWYKRLGASDQLLMLRLPSQEPEPWLDRVLLLVFYLALALVIYLWVWPLSRDARRLEQQTRELGAEGVPLGVKLKPTSALFPLAQSFNRMAQRLRDLLASHRDMTNAVSHELRTPLARMKFALALIDTHNLDGKSRAQLESLGQDVSEMESLISGLLAYAGFERHSQALRQSPGPMAHLGELARAQFARLNNRGLHFDVADLSAGASCHCEWKLMETLLNNLLANAARFAHQQIKLSLGVSDQGYWLAVEDDGPGIAAQDRLRVFESFTRLTPTQGAAKTPGFGLGLAIVQRIMLWHGGSARVEQGQSLAGARFVVAWPAVGEA